MEALFDETFGLLVIYHFTLTLNGQQKPLSGSHKVNSGQ